MIGGYLLRWSWTGYHGNTLWDWLNLLLAPLVFPTILLPALLKWISGNADRRASEARKAPVIQMLRGLTQASLFPLSFDSTSVILVRATQLSTEVFSARANPAFQS